MVDIECHGVSDDETESAVDDYDAREYRYWPSGRSILPETTALAVPGRVHRGTFSRLHNYLKVIKSVKRSTTVFEMTKSRINHKTTISSE